jgi:ABC-2 type transport system ATP-binding protein
LTTAILDHYISSIMQAFSVQKLSKSYSNGVQALKGIDLDVAEGDFFGLMGANGAGKTTLIGILTGLVNKTSGTAQVFGHDLDTDVVAAKKMIGVVPQEFNFSMFDKVMDIVVWQGGYFGMSPLDARIRCEELLKQLDLWDKRDKVSRTLSGGMKRRLMIARALIHRPRFLILDEPTAGVDVELRQGMWTYLESLNKNDGATILLTTHYLEEIENLCNNVAIIKTGEIIKKDSVANLLASADKTTYILNVLHPIDHGAMNQLGIANLIIEDDVTLAIPISKGDSVSHLLSRLSASGVEVTGIRPKGNRMEELFLSILNESK